MICQRDAPTAARIANSRPRAAPRAARRFARFAQAIENDTNRGEKQTETRAIFANLVLEQRSCDVSANVWFESG